MTEEKIINASDAWEDSSQQHDFFGDVNLVKDTIVDTVEKDDIETAEEVAAKKTDKVEPTKEEAELAEEKEIDDQFASFDKDTVETEEEEEEEDTTGKIKTKTPTTNVSNLGTMEFLKEKGLLTYELEEGEKMTEAKAEAMLEDTWETSIDAGVEETIKDLPIELKNLIKHSTKGGNIGELLSAMATSASSGLTKDSDIATEATQVLAITMDLTAQGHDQEYIDAQIEFLKTSEKLEAISTKSYNKIIAEQDASATAQVERATIAKENRKKSAREYKTNITTHIGSLKEVKGLTISKTDAAVLPTYISDPTVEMEDGRAVSEFQADLFKVMADKDKVTLLAKLIKSDFDFSSISRKKTTEASRKAREAVQTADKKNIKSTTGVHSKSKKPLWDMLD
jgi:hypothetical protein